MVSIPRNFANNPTTPASIGTITSSPLPPGTQTSGEPVNRERIDGNRVYSNGIDISAISQTIADQSDLIKPLEGEAGRFSGGGGTPVDGNGPIETIDPDSAIPNADPRNPPAAVAQWGPAKDLRVKIRVPDEYIRPGTPSAGPENIINRNGGILFPYTPTINYENKAEYNSQAPTHSNFSQHFYKNSSVGPISITGKFTVQNEFEGAILLGTIHLLRALTKMRFGNDDLAGSPPPVCRLDGYGDYMLYNVPVSIAGWRHEINEGVDFIAVGRPGSSTQYGKSLVPTISTINIELNVMYSRQEMLAHNIPDWLAGNLRYRGYL